MTKIERNAKKCSTETYDVIIVGGGIYGVMLSYEAARRNLRSLMLEKDDLWGATSLNHLRTVHGGLRYLQSLDIPRFMESVAERRWFLQYFPQYINIMPCLMPLYNKGLHRRIVMWAALTMNDTLSFNRNRRVKKERHLPRGRIVSPQTTREIFPGVDDNGLKGSAVWYDANVQEYQRLMVDLVKIAAASGASVLNYMNVKGLLTENGTAVGVRAEDGVSGETYEFKAAKVINAAGPWSRDVASLFDKDHVSLFKKRLLLWNVLFDREALSDYSLALSPIKGGGHTYFFHPWKNRLLVGTGEVVVQQSPTETEVPADEMDHFIKDMNIVVPGLNVSEKNIRRVYSGILPANDNGRLSGREVIFDHSTNGGPNGLYSVSGVKFTTSRLVADKTLNRVFPDAEKMPHETVLERSERPNLSFGFDWEPAAEEDFRLLKDIVQNEAVVHLDDLILRRTSLGDNPERAKKILPKIRHLFGWDDVKWQNEEEKLVRMLTSL